MTHDHRPVELPLKPSKILWYWIVSIHFLVSFSLLVAGHSLLLQLIFQACLVVSLIASYRSWKQLPWQKISCDKGHWVLVDNHQHETPAELLRFYRFGLLWIVSFRWFQGNRRKVTAIPLLPDNCDADNFRRLRQLLLHASPQG